MLNFNVYLQPAVSLYTSRLSPCSLLGSVHRLRQLRSGLQLHRPQPAPRRFRLDPEQAAHTVQRDPRRAARHPAVHRSQRGQAAGHQPGCRLL